MDKQTKERRIKATKVARWKIVYYCEMMRNGKTHEEAKAIADKKA